MGSSNENSALRPRAESVGDRSHAGRLERRIRGGRRRLGARRSRSDPIRADPSGSRPSFCGVVGLKPTYGRVSRYGLLAFASSLDQIGPLARTAADAALALAVLAGRRSVRRHRVAAASARLHAPRSQATSKALRIGVPRAFVTDGVDEGVRRAFDDGARGAAGARARRSSTSSCRTPRTPFRSTTWSPPRKRARTWRATTASATDTGRRATSEQGLKEMYSRTRDEGFGPEVKRRIMLGTYVLSAGYYDAFYLKAQQVRTLLRQDYERRSRRSTSWRCRRARRRRSGSARRRTIRCRCIWPTCLR